MSRYTYLSLFFIIVAFSLFSSHVVYQQYKTSQLNTAMNYLSVQTAHNVSVFEEWLLNRQNEMRFVSASAYTKNKNKKEIENLLVNIAELNGNYDTLFFVDLEGRGVVGVDYKNGQSRVIPRDEAEAFFVQDRDWFKNVREGNDTFSEPLISRATGKRVSTISVPVFDNDKFVGIIRGAVLLSSLLERVGNIQKVEGGEIFLVDQRGFFVTPNQAMLAGKLQSQTEAATVVKNKTNWTGSYINDLEQEVLGSVIYIPLLNWGLVYEVNKDVAMNDVYETFKDLFILGILSLLFAVMMFSVLFKDPKDLSLYRASSMNTVEGNGPTPSKVKETSQYPLTTDGPMELIEKMANTNNKIDESLVVLEDVHSRVNISTLELEQIIKNDKQLSEIPQFSKMVKELRYVDSMLKKTDTETKDLIRQQSWLIEQLKKLFQKV